MDDKTGHKDNARVIAVLTALLAWGRENRRDFLWRGETDPYRLLVAEVLLQRSRSTTVDGVYRRFVSRWPNAESLVEADIQKVRTVIKPLGFERRAKILVTIAGKLLEGHGTNLPELKELPGVGELTALAVAACLGQGALPMDSVSSRVYERVLGATPDAALRRELERVCRSTGIDTGELNWSVLDLAATWCFPRRPKCPHCPAIGVCTFAQAEVKDGE